MKDNDKTKVKKIRLKAKLKKINDTISRYVL